MLVRRAASAAVSLSLKSYPCRYAFRLSSIRSPSTYLLHIKMEIRELSAACTALHADTLLADHWTLHPDSATRQVQIFIRMIPNLKKLTCEWLCSAMTLRNISDDGGESKHT